MLPDKLSSLGDNFGVSVIKSVFPYKFATEDHLFYVGDMPSMNYYQDISLEGYNSMIVSL